MSRENRRALLAGVIAGVLTFLVITATEAHCADLDFITPAAIYTVGGAADGSMSLYALHGRLELREYNRFGVVGGAAFTSALFFGADLFLQKHAPLWAAKALRWVYVSFVAILVSNSLIKAQAVRR